MSEYSQDRLRAILHTLANHPKPNYTQIQLAIQEVDARERNQIVLAETYRTTRHHMETAYKLDSLDPEVGQVPPN